MGTLGGGKTEMKEGARCGLSWSLEESMCQ